MTDQRVGGINRKVPAAAIVVGQRESPSLQTSPYRRNFNTCVPDSQAAKWVRNGLPRWEWTRSLSRYTEARDETTHYG